MLKFHGFIGVGECHQPEFVEDKGQKSPAVPQTTGSNAFFYSFNSHRILVLIY